MAVSRKSSTITKTSFFCIPSIPSRTIICATIKWITILVLYYIHYFLFFSLFSDSLCLSISWTLSSSLSLCFLASYMFFLSLVLCSFFISLCLYSYPSSFLLFSPLSCFLSHFLHVFPSLKKNLRTFHFPVKGKRGKKRPCYFLPFCVCEKH